VRVALKAFRRVRDHGWLGGVCAGLGYSLGVPTWVLRLTVTVLTFFYGIGAVAYLLLWVFMPQWPPGQPADYDQVAGG
jgi:phage shock protein PspC (stress-responsive transcriptional regulator)